MKYRKYNILTPTPQIGPHAKVSEEITVRKEPLIPKEEFYEWIHQHIVCCSLVIPKRRPVFCLNLEAFGQDSFYLCHSCFPQLIEECGKTREQLREETRIIEE